MEQLNMLCGIPINHKKIAWFIGRVKSATHCKFLTNHGDSIVCRSNKHRHMLPAANNELWSFSDIIVMSGNTREYRIGANTTDIICEPSAVQINDDVYFPYLAFPRWKSFGINIIPSCFDHSCVSDVLHCRMFIKDWAGTYTVWMYICRYSGF